MIFSYLLMIVSLGLISLNIFQGFFDFTVFRNHFMSDHTRIGILATIVYYFSQAFIIFLFIAMGKIIKTNEDVFINYKDRVNELLYYKKMMFRNATINMFLIGTSFLLGGAVHVTTLELPIIVHSIPFTMAWGQLFSVYYQYHNFFAMNVLLLSDAFSEEQQDSV